MGPAHTDPKGGIRVMLVPTFAARPLESKHQRIESRVLSIGTVYGNHWTQWGHTVSDHRNATKFMQQPWRTLRSLGIYSTLPYHSWNLWDQGLSRIANDDVVIYPEQFVQRYFHPWVSKILFGKVPESNEIEEDQMAETFTNFLLENLFRWRRISSFLQYFLVTLVVILASILSQGNRTSKVSRVCRLMAVKVIILSIFAAILFRISRTSWANNIMTKRLLNLPESVAQFPALPATLPSEDDILIPNHMQSEYLGAYTRIFDEAHPGNRFWNQNIVNHFAFGFENLSPTLQSGLCTSIINLIGNEGRRVLTKNTDGNWAAVTDDQFNRFCHTELMKRCNPYVKEAVQQIDYLWTETQYGYWRDTALHRRVMPEYLMTMRDALVKYSVDQDTSRQVEEFLPRFPLKVRNVLGNVPSGSRSYLVRSSSIPASFTPKPTEPFAGAWLQEGDLVEALYKDEDGQYCKFDFIFWLE
jgi:hypothetical protein